MSKKNKNKQTTPQTASIPQETVKPVEVYLPSENSNKYPEPEKTGKLEYRVITYRNDHIRLQEVITEHLNDGWELVGGVSTAFHADSYSTLNMFSQAIVKRF